MSRKLNPNQTLKDKGPVVIGWLMGGSSTPGFVQSITKTIALSPQLGVDLIGSIPKVSGPRIADARNGMAIHFLQSPGEWIFLVDDDMNFEADSIARLLEVADPVDRPIVGGLAYAAGRDGYFSTVWTLNEEHSVPERVDDVPANMLIQVVATGAACLLVHRSVFEKLLQVYGDQTAWPFFQETSYNGRTVGEDVTFCLRAGAQGFPIHVDTSVEFGHEKLVNVNREFVDMWRQAHRVLIVGTGRCGTGYLSAVLTAAAIPATHEGVWNSDGFVGWQWQRVEASWMAVPHLSDFDGPVLHLVRDPLKTAASLRNTGLFGDVMDPNPYRDRILDVLPDLFDEPDPWNRVMRFMVEWNRMIEAAGPAKLLHIERVDADTFQMIADMVGSRHSSVDFDHPIQMVPDDYNHQHDYTDVGWVDLPDGEWKAALQNQYREYGYAV